MTRDVDADGEVLGARRALAAFGHELASPLTALFTFLKLGKPDEVRRCADRIQSIAELARELSALDTNATGTTNIALAIESAAARLAVEIKLETAGEPIAAIATNRVLTVITALVRAVVNAAPGAAVIARVARRDDRIAARIDPGIEPAAWRVVEPWRSGTGHKLDLWAAAVAAGAGSIVRVGEHDGQIAVDLELPAAGSR